MKRPDTKNSRTAAYRRALSALGSERGASLTAALLFFIICAVLGAAIFFASNYITGRISSAAEEDSIHAGVISAAGLLKDRFDGGETVVVITRTTAGEGYEAVVTYSSTVDGRPVRRAQSLLYDMAVNIAFGPFPNATDGKEAWDYTEPDPFFGSVRFVIVPEIPDADATSLTVNATATLAADYTLTVQFENKTGGKKYKARLVCTPQITKDSARREEQTEDGASVTVEEKTVTVRWTVSDVEELR